MKPLVSIVLSLTGSLGDIKACLESIRSQTFSDFEALLFYADAGGASGLPEWVDDDKRFTCRQADGNAASHWNMGITLARGEYLLFLDDSVALAGNVLDAVKDEATAHGPDVILFGGEQYSVHRQELSSAGFMLKTAYLPADSPFCAEDIPRDIFFVTSSDPWTKAFRREFLIQNNILFQELENTYDFCAVYTSLALAERVCASDKVLATQRVWDAGEVQPCGTGDPCAFIDASLAFFVSLKKHGCFEALERAAVRAVLFLTACRLKATTTESGLWKMIARLRSSDFAALGILDHPNEFYLGKENRAYVAGMLVAAEWNEHHAAWLALPGDYSIERRAKSSERVAVSVIIPMFNVGPYADECLASIVGQTLRNIEIICVDDGSTDDTIDHIRYFAAEDDRVTVIRQRNLGVSVARNHALAEARGRYIYFMDGDDVLRRNALELLVELADKDALDCVLFDADCFHENKCEKSMIGDNRYHRQAEYPTISRGIELFRAMRGKGEFLVSPCLYLTRREHIERWGLSFHRGVVHEDNAFSTLNVALARRCGYIREPLFVRRVRANSIMTKHESFDNAYGYYVAYRDLDARLDDFSDCTDDERTAVFGMAIRLLRSSREIQSRLPGEQRNVYMLLPPEERYWYERDVALPAEWKAGMTDRNTKMKDARLKLERYRREAEDARRKLNDTQNQLRKSQAQNKKLTARLNRVDQTTHKLGPVSIRVTLGEDGC